MNKQRRKDIEILIGQIQDAAETISSIKGDLENLKDEEQEYYDNMPESLQGGEKGYAAEAAVSALEDALSILEDFDADSIVTSLESAGE